MDAIKYVTVTKKTRGSGVGLFNSGAQNKRKCVQKWREIRWYVDRQQQPTIYDHKGVVPQKKHQERIHQTC